jgi:predicted lipoprotein
MRDMKLLAPLGDSADKAKPQSSEYWRSGQSIAVLEANVEGLRMLFKQDSGLAGLLLAQPDGKIPAYQMLAAVESTRNRVTALRNLKLPLDKIVTDPKLRQHVEALAKQLAEMRDILAGRVAPKLNLPIGFNALDGD